MLITTLEKIISEITRSMNLLEEKEISLKNCVDYLELNDLKERFKKALKERTKKEEVEGEEEKNVKSNNEKYCK